MRTLAAGLGFVPQEIGFCRAPDGVRIAFAQHGTGPALVIATCWMSHLQFDWRSPVWRHFLAELGAFSRVTRYDERGHGLSDWDVPDFGLQARVADLEAVVDATGPDRFALLGMSSGAPVALAYAARHPDRVSRLVLYGGHPGLHRSPTTEEDELATTFAQMIKVGWGTPSSVFRRVFTSLMIPGASEEQMRWLDDLQRMAVSADNARTFYLSRRVVDVSHVLPQLAMPTLVLHAVNDQMADFGEGRLLASSIAGARLVALDSANHILLEDEPAWPVFVRELKAFLGESDHQAPPTSSDGLSSLLSARELNVLRLAALGQDNQAIALHLTISVRTVERHLHNIYVKLGLTGKKARVAAVARLLTHG